MAETEFLFTQTALQLQQDINYVETLKNASSGTIYSILGLDSNNTPVLESASKYLLYSYTDLSNKPQINNITLSGNKTLDDFNIQSKITSSNKLSTSLISGLATVATSGSYNDLSNKPTIPTVSYPVTDVKVNGTSVVAGTVAKISIPDTSDMATKTWVSGQGYLTSVSWSDINNKPVFADVATTGSYTDLSNKPTIPDAQVNSDWNATSGVAQILNKPPLATVATSGSYSDLSNKPTIPVNLPVIGEVGHTGGTEFYPVQSIKIDFNIADSDKVCFIRAGHVAGSAGTGQYFCTFPISMTYNGKDAEFVSVVSNARFGAANDYANAFWVTSCNYLGFSVYKYMSESVAFEFIAIGHTW